MAPSIGFSRGAIAGMSIWNMRNMPRRAGRNDLYLEVLRLLEPRLASQAVIVADLNVEDPDLLPYLRYVSEPASGYLSVAVPLDEGVELSLRTP